MWTVTFTRMGPYLWSWRQCPAVVRICASYHAEQAFIRSTPPVSRKIGRVRSNTNLGGLLGNQDAAKHGKTEPRVRPGSKLDGDIIGCIAMNYAQSVVTFGSGAVSAADY